MKLKTPLQKLQRGFSLVELVATIVLMGVISTFAVSRFAGSDTFADYAARDLVVTAARIAQQRAMLDHSAGSCYRLNVSDGRVGAQGFDGTVYRYVGLGDWQSGIELDDEISVANASVYFDRSGSVLSGTGCGSAATAASIIPIIGSSGLQVCLHSSGYIIGQDGGDACI